MARDRGARRGRMLAFVALALATTLVPAGRAGADSGTVTVTATVSPTFSLTVLTDSEITFGECALGATYTADEQQRLRVVSGRAWDFSDSSDARVTAGAVDVPRDQIFKHTVTPGFGEGLSAGVYEITCTYVLDLTTPEAMSLPTGTAITTHFGYSAVQR